MSYLFLLKYTEEGVSKPIAPSLRPFQSPFTNWSEYVGSILAASPNNIYFISSDINWAEYFEG